MTLSPAYIDELAAMSAPVGTDLLLVEYDPSSTRVAKKLSFTALVTYLNSVITSSSGGGATQFAAPPSAWTPADVNGCSYPIKLNAYPGNVSNPTTYPGSERFHMLFDASTDESAWFERILPSNYNGGAITIDTWWEARLRVLSDCETAWTAVGSNVTQTNDTGTFIQGLKSLKLAMAAGATANLIAAHLTIASTNMTGDKYIVLWVYPSVALAAGDWQVLLDDTAACASPIKALDIPACTANQWNLCEIALGDMSGCSAIISLGLKQVVDIGAANLFFDNIGTTGDITVGAQMVHIGSLADRVTLPALGTAVTTTVTPRYGKPIKATLTSVMPSNTPLANGKLITKLYRDADAATDTHAADAGFSDAIMTYTAAV